MDPRPASDPAPVQEPRLPKAQRKKLRLTTASLPPCTFAAGTNVIQDASSLLCRHGSQDLPICGRPKVCGAPGDRIDELTTSPLAWPANKQPHSLRLAAFVDRAIGRRQRRSEQIRRLAARS